MASRDDWDGGEPPEGRHTRDQADPGHWQRQWKAQAIVFGVLGLMVVLVIVLALI
ncbi:MAG: hypothetical protein V9E83_03450 [Baekduia sp.]